MSQKEQLSESFVSLVIPVYNEERFIPKCLQSLERQTYDKKHFEVLLIDGGSTDSTLSIIEEYSGDLNIRLLNNEKRIVTYALNLGISEAVGQFILRMDAHAEYDEQYIEKCIQCLIETGADNVGGVATTRGIGLIGSVNAEILSSKFGVGNSHFRTECKSGYVDTVPFGAFRREVFEKVGVFDPELPRSEDNDFNSRIHKKGGKVYLSTDIKFTYYCRDTIKGLLEQAVKNGNALFLTLRRNPMAMSVRHFVPFAFLCSIIFLTIFSVWFSIFRYIFCLEAAAYGILDLYFSAFKGNIKTFPLKFLMYPLFHITYGVGSLLGMINIKLY